MGRREYIKNFIISLSFMDNLDIIRESFIVWDGSILISLLIYSIITRWEFRGIILTKLESVKKEREKNIKKERKREEVFKELFNFERWGKLFWI